MTTLVEIVLGESMELQRAGHDSLQPIDVVSINKERASRRLLDVARGLVNEEMYERILNCFERTHSSQDEKVLCVMNCLNNIDPCLAKRCVMRIQKKTDEVYDTTKQCFCKSTQQQKRSHTNAFCCGDTEDSDGSSKKPVAPDGSPANLEVTSKEITENWFRACRENNVDEMQTLFLASNCVLDAYDERTGQTALMVAAKYSLVKMATSLLEWGASMCKKDKRCGKTPLWFAICGKQKEMVEMLLSKGACPNASTMEGFSPLMLAAKTGQESIAEVLLSNGADVDAADCRGFTPLMFAATHCNTSILVLLSQYKAKLDITDKCGCNALILAARSGCVESVLVLTQLGSPHRATDKDGYSALHYAARAGHHSVLTALFSIPCGVYRRQMDLPCSKGNTPLMLAAQFGRLSCVKLLIENGSSLCARNCCGFTAFDLANIEGQRTVTAYISSIVKNPHCPS